MRGAIAGLLALALAVPAARAGHSLLRRDAGDRARLESWIRYARREGFLAVLMPRGLTEGPAAVPLDRMRRIGKVLAVRAGPLAGPDPEAPSLVRTLYYAPLGRRGPDQIPLPGQWFLERWVEAGGAAVSTFPSTARFDWVADEGVPLGDALLALGYLVASPTRALFVERGVLHVARLRGGRRQRLTGDLVADLPGVPWRLPPDRRPATEVLALDARAGRFDLVVDEPVASRTIWAGGRATPGAFTTAVAHSLPATVGALGRVVGIAVGRRPEELVPEGRAGSPWTRRGFAPPAHLLPPGLVAGTPRKLWVHLAGARRDHVRAVAAWVSRARPRGE